MEDPTHRGLEQRGPGLGGWRPRRHPVCEHDRGEPPPKALIRRIQYQPIADIATTLHMFVALERPVLLKFKALLTWKVDAPNMTRKELLTLALFVGIGVIASYALQNANSVGDDVSHSFSAREIMQDDRSPAVGHGRSDVTMIVFADYQCPACRKADPGMRRAIARDGNVRIIYKDWPIFGRRSERAAKVALAAARQGIYSRVHHALMASPRLDEAGLREAVETSGGNWQRIVVDLHDHAP